MSPASLPVPAAWLHSSHVSTAATSTVLCADNRRRHQQEANCYGGERRLRWKRFNGFLLNVCLYFSFAVRLLGRRVYLQKVFAGVDGMLGIIFASITGLTVMTKQCLHFLLKLRTCFLYRIPFRKFCHYSNIHKYLTFLKLSMTSAPYDVT